MINYMNVQKWELMQSTQSFIVDRQKREYIRKEGQRVASQLVSKVSQANVNTETT